MSREREDQPMGTADLLAARDAARTEPMRERAEPMRESLEPMRERMDLTREQVEPMGERIETVAGRTADMAPRPADTQEGLQREELAALFDPHHAQDFRSRWTEVQSGFVDDPRQAVQHADELVAEVMQSLAQSFARQRSEIEAGVAGEGGQEQASTENLRLALRRYRSFFDRLLTL